MIQIGSKFRVQIGPKGVKRSVGTYSSAKEAARAYDKAAVEIFGHGAVVNFPEELPRHHSAAAPPTMPGQARYSSAVGLGGAAQRVGAGGTAGGSSCPEYTRQATKMSAREGRMEMHVPESVGSGGQQPVRETAGLMPGKAPAHIATDFIRKNTRVLRSGEAAYFVPRAVPLDQRPFTTATGYRGVVRKRGKFQAQIGSRKTREYLGTYKTAEEAACVYDREAIKRFGNRAAVNFRFYFED